MIYFPKGHRDTNSIHCHFLLTEAIFKTIT